MNVCKWGMSGSATENSILLSVLPRLNKMFNQSINHCVWLLYIFPHVELSNTMWDYNILFDFILHTFPHDVKA